VTARFRWSGPAARAARRVGDRIAAARVEQHATRAAGTSGVRRRTVPPLTLAGMWSNWSGGQQARPRATDRPLDEAGVVAAVRRAAARGQRIRPVGAGRSWSPLAVTDEVQLDCSALTGVVAVADGRVRARAGATLAAVLAELDTRGLTLDAVPAALDVTVAGAVTTGTHGSGAGTGSLSAAVTGVRLVDGTATVRSIEGPALDGARCGLGVLGVLTEVDLAVVPAVTLAAREELVPLAEVLACGVLDAHRWVELVVFGDRQVLVRRADPVTGGDVTAPARGDTVRAAAVGSAQALARAVPRLAPALQRSTGRWSGSVTGPAHRVLAGGRAVREERTEWALPRPALEPVLRELDAAAAALGVGPRPPLLVRVGPAETGWLHPAHGRATAWVGLRVPAEHGLFRLVSSVLGAAGGRPHWAARHDWAATDVEVAYPRLPDFRRLRARLDPDRRFAGPVLDALLGP